MIGIWDGCEEYYIKAGIFHEDRGYGAVFIRLWDCERAFLGDIFMMLCVVVTVVAVVVYEAALYGVDKPGGLQWIEN